MKQFLKNNRKIIFRVLQVIVLAVIFYFLGRNLVDLDWDNFLVSLKEAEVGLLVLSLVITVGGGLLVALGWGLILRILGQKVPLPAVLKIYYFSELAKYVPGKIWTAVGRVVMLEKRGVPRLITLASVGVMLIILAVSGVLVAVATLPLWPNLESAGEYQAGLLLLLLVPVGLVLLHPRIFDPVINWFLRRIEHTEFKVELRYPHILLLVLFWCGLWLLKGVATYLLLTVLPDNILDPAAFPPFPWLLFSGIMAISWIVGTISPLTPAGLGIAELSIVIL
ncbi:MAG: lysylphosphatidylglycerol synthase domain-containing protein, partial [Candidatus Auribacterota bacterium]|nr:lysylphosphatidylglycerol synthase domain-containing protein [Candidatus Auribacterota bacterium]